MPTAAEQDPQTRPIGPRDGDNASMDDDSPCCLPAPAMLVFTVPCRPPDFNPSRSPSRRMLLAPEAPAIAGHLGTRSCNDWGAHRWEVLVRQRGETDIFHDFFDFFSSSAV